MRKRRVWLSVRYMLHHTTKFRFFPLLTPKSHWQVGSVCFCCLSNIGNERCHWFDGTYELICLKYHMAFNHLGAAKGSAFGLRPTPFQRP